MKTSAEIDLSKYFEAIESLTKPITECGSAVDSYTMRGAGSNYGEEFWRQLEADSLAAGRVPDLYQFGDLNIRLAPFVDFTQPYSPEDAEKRAQEKREQFIRDFVKLVPDAIVARYENGQSCLFVDREEYPFGVSIPVGQALCERVLVGEDVEEVPDPELVEQALESIPTVKQVTPRYEWRCNDAEFGVVAKQDS